MSEAKKADNDEMVDWPEFIEEIVGTLGEFYSDLTSEMVTGWLREFLESLTPEEKAADDYQSTINERIRANLLERSRQFILERENSGKQGEQQQDPDLNLALRLSEEAQQQSQAQIQEQNLLNENLTGTQLFMRLSEDRRLTIGLIISQLLGTNGIQVDTNSMRNILQYGREANTEIHSLLTYLIQNQHLPLCMYSAFNLASLDERQRRECSEFRNALRSRLVPVLNTLFRYYRSLSPDSNINPSNSNLVFDEGRFLVEGEYPDDLGDAQRDTQNEIFKGN